MAKPTTDDGTAASAAVALPLAGLFLLMPPLVTLFARGASVAGLPLIVIYLFGVWVALIGGAALLARRLARTAPAAAPAPDTPLSADPIN